MTNEVNLLNESKRPFNSLKSNVYKDGDIKNAARGDEANIALKESEKMRRITTEKETLFLCKGGQ